MTVPTVWPGSPRVRQSDPVESHAAADLTTGSVAASQAAVLQILTDASVPLTDEDVAGYLRGRFSASRVRTARHELETDGLVVCVGSVKVPGRRAKCRIWEAAK